MPYWTVVVADQSVQSVCFLGGAADEDNSGLLVNNYRFGCNLPFALGALPQV